jgi:hypothetical protein
MVQPPNLAHRPAKPAKNRGRIQKAARHALLLLDGEATTRDVVSWGYCRKVLRGQRIEKSDYRLVRRALDRIAVRVGRAGGIGRPIVWRLKDAELMRSQRPR